MLNPFPDLLMFGFFAPTLLRVVAALMFVYLAYVHFKNKDAIARIKLPFISGGAWYIWALLVVELIVAAGLFFGYYTQYVAVLALLGLLKHFMWRSRYPQIFVLPRTTITLLIAILLSLLVTGAGALAFDIPL